MEVFRKSLVVMAAVCLYTGNCTASYLSTLVEVGDTSGISKLLHNQVDIDEINEQGKTALIKAIEMNSIDMVRKLLLLGADPNKKAQNGATPLCRAISLERVEMVDLLLRNPYIDVDETGEQGKTALIKAIEANSIDIVNRLLQLGANPNKKTFRGTTPLCYAISLERVEMVDLLLRNPSINVNERTTGTTVPDVAGTHLHAAVGFYQLRFHRNNEENRVRILRSLLARNDIDVNAHDSRGISPLLASLSSNTPSFALVLMNDARVSIEGVREALLQRVRTLTQTQIDEWQSVADVIAEKTGEPMQLPPSVFNFNR